ncbi:MAG: hypothetical protein LUF29_04120 [Oscillospiraceae bacterium]|nr:hypothetical protein [Oscillospiraceae bacterium]
MIRQYSFEYNNQTVEFDDSRSVRELVKYAFDESGYYEPFGMEIVTIFQPQHPAGSYGWFTTDLNKSCAEEIVVRDRLCFAYYMPNVFYFAEGGWGHHMPHLGNHPDIPNPVMLRIELDGERNTVVINGELSPRLVFEKLIGAGYVDEDIEKIKVLKIAYPNHVHSPEIPLNDPILGLPLSEFKRVMEEDAHYIIVRFD